MSKTQKRGELTQKMQREIQKIISEGLPKDPQSVATASSGPVRDQTEQPSSNLCLPLPKRRRSSSGCSVNPLGQMETPLHLPSYQLDLEGHSEDVGLPCGDISFSYSRLSKQTLVHVSNAQEDPFLPNGGHTPTSSSRQTHFPDPPHTSSRVDTIKNSYGKSSHM